MKSLFAYVVLCAVAAGAFGDVPVPGRLTPIVVCQDDPSQTYSLYLPRSYTPDSRFPVILCFDPSGKGTIPVEKLEAAAERYGYVVAGSLVSRNGPWEQNSAAAEALMHDVKKRYSVDENRFYSIGMSGGARVATAIAQSGKVKGAIACGAGFPVSPDKIPSEIPFLFYGVIGSEDFNYAELIRVRDALEERKARYLLRVFDGAHVWPTADVLTEAVEWLELQAIRDGHRPKDDGFIASQHLRLLAEIPAHPGAERLLALKRMAADFEGLSDLSGLRREIDQLSKSRLVKAEQKKERELLAQEEAWLNELAATAMESAVRKQLVANTVRKMSENPENTAERKMIRRAAANYVAIAYETSRALFDQKDYTRALGLLEMTAALKPDHPRTWYDIARAYSYIGDERQAFGALTQAVNVGFSDSRRMAHDKAFASFTDKPKFKALLDQMQSAAGAESAVHLPLMQISAALAHVELRPVYLRSPNEFSPALAFLEVEAVRPNTPAHRAGVQRGMELIAIQGMSVRGLRQGELNALLSMRVTAELNLTARAPGSATDQLISIDLRNSSKPSAEAAAPAPFSAPEPSGLLPQAPVTLESIAQVKRNSVL